MLTAPGKTQKHTAQSLLDGLLPMFTDAALKRLHETVLDCIVAAGWLHSYTFTTGKGFHLTWTKLGALRALRLKGISETYGLSDDDRAPLAFDKFAHGEDLPVLPVPLDEDDRSFVAFWRECIGELAIPREEGTLLVFVGIIRTWAPGADTKIRFE